MSWGDEYPATFPCEMCGHEHKGLKGHGRSYINEWCAVCDCKQWKEVAA